VLAVVVGLIHSYIWTVCRFGIHSFIDWLAQPSEKLKSLT